MNDFDNHIPNHLIVNLNMFFWANPNNIMGVFSPASLFEAYCLTLLDSVGKSDYDWGSLMEWVSEELDPSAGSRPGYEQLMSDANFIMSMQQSVVAGFSSFITDNRHFVMHTLVPVIYQADLVKAYQDGVPHVVRLQCM